jgi:hypothetical protein
MRGFGIIIRVYLTQFDSALRPGANTAWTDVIKLKVTARWRTKLGKDHQIKATTLAPSKSKDFCPVGLGLHEEQSQE